MTIEEEQTERTKMRLALEGASDILKKEEGCNYVIVVVKDVGEVALCDMVSSITPRSLVAMFRQLADNIEEAPDERFIKEGPKDLEIK